MNKLFITGLLGLLLTSTGWTTETVIYMESFSQTGPLNGTLSLKGKRTWIAGDAFHADGTVTTESKFTTATLPFTPQPNRTYTLEARIKLVAPTDPSYMDWIALGYARGQSSEDSPGNRFTDGSGKSDALTQGKAWTYIRPIFNKPDGGNFNDAVLNGTTPIGKYEAYENASDLKVRIVLKTTTPWTATWYARPPGIDKFSKVVSEQTLEHTDITSVGFAKSGDSGIGRIDFFSLRVRGELDADELTKTIGKAAPTAKKKPKPKPKRKPTPKPQEIPEPVEKVEQPPLEKVETLGLITA